MRTNISKLIYGSAAALLLSGAVSCTDLSDTVYSEISTDAFTAPTVDLLMGNVYVKIADLISANNPNLPPLYYSLMTADELVLPGRQLTKEWFGDTKWSSLWKHDWVASVADMDKNWNKVFSIVSASNQTIDMVNDGMEIPEAEKAVILAELRMTRALGYYHLTDIWGDVPYVTSSKVTASEITKSTSAEIYEKIMKEFDECLPILKEAKSDKATTYGKMGYWASLALKAKFLLNAKILLETNREAPTYADETTGLEELIEVCDELINDGGYILEPDIFTNFKAKNEVSKENILVIPYDAVYSTNNKFILGLGLARHGLHKSQSQVLNAKLAGQNGYVVFPSLYRTFSDTDARRNGIYFGQQYAADGTTPLKCIKAQSVEADGKTKLPLDFQLDWDINDCREADGARYRKYEYEEGLNVAVMNNDFVLIRLADIYLMKAEAIMRLNGGTADATAVALVNDVWNRSNATTPDKYTVANLTMDELLEERRRELYGEGNRRNDLIRFEKFTEMGWSADVHMDQADPAICCEQHTTVFPLPTNYLLTAPNVPQHEFYQ